MTIDHMTPTASTVPLRTPADHEHTWRLRDVDHTDGTTVREFGCDTCPAVWFD